MVQMRMEGFKKMKLTEDMERVIEKDDSNSSMTTEYDEGAAYPAACRDHLSLALNSVKFQIAVVSLVVFTGLLIVAELLISLHILELHTHSIVPQVLRYVAIGILSIFVVEVTLKLFCWRLGCLQNKIELFDAVIVIVTFALSMPFSGNSSFHSSIGLLILLRLWRIVKILNGIILSVKVKAERKLRHERHIREALEQELAKFREYCASQEKEIELLQAVLRKHEISYYPVEKPVAVEMISVIAEVNSISEDHQQPSHQQQQQQQQPSSELACNFIS